MIRVNLPRDLFQPLKKIRTSFILLVTFFLLIGTHLWIENHGLIVDEREIHYAIQTLVNNHLDLRESLKNPYPPYSTLPTFHLIIAWIATINHDATLGSLRSYSFLFSLCSIFIFFQAAKKLDADLYDIRTVQYSFFPILYPYFFLLYTDVMSLFFILLALYFSLRKNYSLTAVSGIGSMLIRQNNIVWLAFFFVLLYVEEYGMKFKWQFLYKHFLNGWVFVLGFLSFIVYVILNHGISFHDPKTHHFSFHLGNIYFLLFSFFFLF